MRQFSYKDSSSQINSRISVFQNNRDASVPWLVSKWPASPTAVIASATTGKSDELMPWCLSNRRLRLVGAFFSNQVVACYASLSLSSDDLFVHCSRLSSEPWQQPRLCGLPSSPRCCWCHFPFASRRQGHTNCLMYLRIRVFISLTIDESIYSLLYMDLKIMKRTNKDNKHPINSSA